jgi:hypothetical protein
VGTEPGAPKRGHDPESFLLEHRHSAVCGLISEGVRFPASDGIGLNQAATLFSDGFQSGFQRSACSTASAIFLIDNKARYSPKSLFNALGGKPSILAAVVDTRKLFGGAVLAPSYWYSFRLDEYPMRGFPLDECSLFSTVPHASLGPGVQSLVFGQGARSVKVHAPTEVPPILLREELLKIRPGLL